MKKLNIILSSIALALSTASLFFAYTTNKILQETLAQTDLSLLSYDIDRLQYDLAVLAKNTIIDRSTRWVRGDGYWDIEASALGIGFRIPTYWAVHESDIDSPTRLTIFTNDVIDANKWSLIEKDDGGAEVLIPDILAYRGWYPHYESFLATLEEVLGSNDQNIAHVDLLDEARFVYEKDAEKACKAFEKLVLTHSTCKQINDRVWYVEYATYTDDGDFTAPGEPWIAGGFMWFVSLEGAEGVYNGFTIGYQMREALETWDMDAAAIDFLTNNVQNLKSTSEFKDLQSGVDLVLKTLELL